MCSQRSFQGVQSEQQSPAVNLVGCGVHKPADLFSSDFLIGSVAPALEVDFLSGPLFLGLIAEHELIIIQCLWLLVCHLHLLNGIHPVLADLSQQLRVSYPITPDGLPGSVDPEAQPRFDHSS